MHHTCSQRERERTRKKEKSHAKLHTHTHPHAFDFFVHYSKLISYYDTNYDIYGYMEQLITAKNVSSRPGCLLISSVELVKSRFECPRFLDLLPLFVAIPFKVQ